MNKITEQFFVAQPIKWMNFKVTNLLDRVNEIYAFPAPYAIKYRSKRKRGYILYPVQWTPTQTLQISLSVQCFEVSIINILKRKITKNLSSVKNLPIFTNRNERNLVLSCPWSTTINLFQLFKKEGRTKQLTCKYIFFAVDISKTKTEISKLKLESMKSQINVLTKKSVSPSENSKLREYYILVF